MTILQKSIVVNTALKAPIIALRRQGSHTYITSIGTRSYKIKEQREAQSMLDLVYFQTIRNLNGEYALQLVDYASDTSRLVRAGKMTYAEALKVQEEK